MTNLTEGAKKALLECRSNDGKGVIPASLLGRRPDLFTTDPSSEAKVGRGYAKAMLTDAGRELAAAL